MVVMAESKKMMSVQKFMEAISYVYLSNHPSPHLKKPIVPQVRIERLPRHTIEKYTKRQQRHKKNSSKPATSSLKSCTKKHKNTGSLGAPPSHPEVSLNLPLTETPSTSLNSQKGYTAEPQHTKAVVRSDLGGVRKEPSKSLEADKAGRNIQEVPSSRLNAFDNSPSSDSDLPDLMNPMTFEDIRTIKKTEVKKKKASPKKKRSKKEKKRLEPKLMKKTKKAFEYQQKFYSPGKKDATSKTERRKNLEDFAGARDLSTNSSTDMESNIVIVSFHSLANSSADHIDLASSEHTPSLKTSSSPPAGLASVPSVAESSSEAASFSETTGTAALPTTTSKDEEEFLKKIKAHMKKSLSKYNLPPMDNAIKAPDQTAKAIGEGSQAGEHEQEKTSKESTFQRLVSSTGNPLQQEKGPNVCNLKNILSAAEVPLEAAKASCSSTQPDIHQQEKATSIGSEPTEIADEVDDHLELVYDSEGNESTDSDKTVIFGSRSMGDNLDVETVTKTSERLSDTEHVEGTVMMKGNSSQPSIVQAENSEERLQLTEEQNENNNENRGSCKRKTQDLLEDMPDKRIKKEVVPLEIPQKQNRAMVMIPLCSNTSASAHPAPLSYKSIGIAPPTTIPNAPLVTAVLPSNTESTGDTSFLVEPGDGDPLQAEQDTRVLSPLPSIVQEIAPPQQSASLNIPSSSQPPDSCISGSSTLPDPSASKVEEEKGNQQENEASKETSEDLEGDKRIVLRERETDGYPNQEEKKCRVVHQASETIMEVEDRIPQLKHVTEIKKSKVNENIASRQTAKNKTDSNSTGIKNLMLLVSKKRKCEEKIEQVKKIMERKISILEARKKKLENKINNELDQMNKDTITITTDDDDDDASDKSDSEDLVSDIGSPLSDRSKSPEVPKTRPPPSAEITEELHNADVSITQSKAAANASSCAGRAAVTNSDDQASPSDNADTGADNSLPNDITTTSANQNTGAFGCLPCNQEFPESDKQPVQAIKVIKDASAATFGKNTELEPIVQQVDDSDNSCAAPSPKNSEMVAGAPTFRVVPDPRPPRLQGLKTTKKVKKQKSAEVSAASSTPETQNPVPAPIQKAHETAQLHNVRKYLMIPCDVIKGIKPYQTSPSTEAPTNSKMLWTQKHVHPLQSQPQEQQSVQQPQQKQQSAQQPQQKQQSAEQPQQKQQSAQQPQQKQQSAEQPQQKQQSAQQPQQKHQSAQQPQQKHQSAQQPQQKHQSAQQPQQKQQSAEQPQQKQQSAQQPQQKHQSAQQPQQKHQSAQQPQQKQQSAQQPQQKHQSAQQPQQKQQSAQQPQQKQQSAQQPQQKQQSAQQSQQKQQSAQQPQQKQQSAQQPQQKHQSAQQPQQKQQSAQQPQQKHQSALYHYVRHLLAQKANHMQQPVQQLQQQQQPVQQPQQRQQPVQQPQQRQQPVQQPQQRQQPLQQPQQRQQPVQQPQQTQLHTQQPQQIQQPVQQPLQRQHPVQQPQQTQLLAQQPQQIQQPVQQPLQRQQPVQQPQQRQHPVQQPQQRQQPQQTQLLAQKPQQIQQPVQQPLQRQQPVQQPQQTQLLAQQPQQIQQPVQQPLQRQQPVQQPQQTQLPTQQPQQIQQPVQQPQQRQQFVQQPQQGQQFVQQPQQGQQFVQYPQQLQQLPQALQLQYHKQPISQQNLRSLFKQVYMQQPMQQQSIRHTSEIPQQQQVSAYPAQSQVPHQSHVQQQVSLQMQMQMQQNSLGQLILGEQIPSEAPMVSQASMPNQGGQLHQGPSGIGSINTGIQPHFPQEASVLPVSNISGNMAHAHQVNRTMTGLVYQVFTASSSNTEVGQQQVSDRFTASVPIAIGPITTSAITSHVAAEPSNMPSNAKKNTTGKGNENQQFRLQGVQKTAPSLQHTVHAYAQSPASDTSEEDGKAHEKNWCFICGKIGEFTCCNGIVYCSKSCQEFWPQNITL
ncbi:titin homolog isoform X2 [Penaeus chinensis]|uniref:titin homolog isoform X2 n=1 Tax=Penaeus chinensis TaxID=139456 RepID=UPI001FB64461|nr:titin homolog isoform X2 [Penaeus chinensis]